MRARFVLCLALVGPHLVSPVLEDSILFHDPFEKTDLADGWSWLREHPGFWRSNPLHPPLRPSHEADARNQSS